MKKTLIFTLLILCFRLMGQENVSVFYTQDWEITTVKKATYYRITGLNAEGNAYNGKFADYLLKGSIQIGSGEYVSNKKNGEFSEYYENGNLKQQGSYKNNVPTGRWVYNYPTGRLRMSVDFSEKDFEPVECRDSLNNITLDKGTGIWETLVNVYGVPSKLKATFKNGKRTGTWEYVDKDGKNRLKEIYKNSQLESSNGFDEWGHRSFDNPYLGKRHFIDSRFEVIDRIVCVRDLNVKYTPINWVNKILTLSNSPSINNLNSKMPVDKIICMNVDSNNTCWFGTANNGLIKYDSVFTFYNKKNSDIKGNYVQAIAIDKNQKIWFSYKSNASDYDVATAGLACLSNNRLEIYNTKNSGLTSNSINDIGVDSNNKKWFATLNCIISLDEATNKWDKHFNKSESIRGTDTLKIKNQDEYFRHAKEIESKTTSYETKVPNYSKSYNTEIEPTVNHYRTMTTYESPSNYSSIDVLPGNEKLINSFKSGCSIYNDKTWECDSSKLNVGYVNLMLKKKFQLNEQEIDQYMSQLSKIMTRNIILKLIKGVDNSIWVLNGNNVFKITKTKIIEFDVIDKKICLFMDGNLKSNYYNLFQDKDGGIWACINSGVLKIE